MTNNTSPCLNLKRGHALLATTLTGGILTSENLSAATVLTEIGFRGLGFRA